MTPSNPRARHHVLGIVALSLFFAYLTRRRGENASSPGEWVADEPYATEVAGPEQGIGTLEPVR